MKSQLFPNEIKYHINLRKPKGNQPTTVFFVVALDGKQIRLTTQTKVYPEHWSSLKQQAYISVRLTESDNHNNTIVNEKLNELKSDFMLFKQYLCDHPFEDIDKIDLLRQYIYKDKMKKSTKEVDAIAWLNKALLDDRTIKESTKVDYLKQVRFFKEFLNDNGIYPISFNDLTLSVIKDYETYLFNKDVGKGKTTKTTTVGNKVEKIIAIIRRAETHGMIDIHNNKLDKYSKPQSRQGDDNEIYLTEDEIQSIYDLQLTGNEETVRDMFVLQCWIGQRFDDTQNINAGIIKDTKNGRVLEIVQGKKTHKVSIPLFPIALEIINKYEFNFPTISNQLALLHLKKIGEKASIKRLHNVTEDRGGIVTTTKVKAFELIGTHTARRSYITNMLKRGIDSKLIKKITGHSKDESFEKYVKLTSEDAAIAILDNVNASTTQTSSIAQVNVIQPQSNNDLESMLKQFIELHTPKDTKTKLDNKNNVLFDALFCKRWTGIAFKTYCTKVRGIKQSDQELSNYDNAIATIIKDINKPDTIIKMAIDDYKPNQDDYFKLRSLIGSWIELKLDDEIIFKYIERAKQVGIDTNGLKEYIEQTKSYMV